MSEVYHSPARRAAVLGETEPGAEFVVDCLNVRLLGETTPTEGHLRPVGVLTLLVRVEIEVVLGVGA